MSSADIDPAGILNRALEYATQNLRIENLLIQLGLDPSNLTYAGPTEQGEIATPVPVPA